MKNRMKVKRKRINKRFIPNIFTILNMFLGFLAIGLLLKGDPLNAGLLILIAGILDAFDGKLARLLGIPSKFGVEFDSFADTVSFCVAPSVLVYTTYINGLAPLLGGMIAFIPLLFGTVRLAKFNLLQNGTPKSYTLGLTTPVNSLALFGYLFFNHRVDGDFGDPRTALVLVVVMGFLMLSPIQFIKFPLLSFRQGRANTSILIGLLVAATALILWRGLVLFPMVLVYITWNILRWMIDPHRFQETISYSTTTDTKPDI